MNLFIIKNAHIVASGEESHENLLIGGGKILATGNSLLSFSDIPCIDAENQRLIPGLIDNHCHITGASGEAGAHTRAPEIPASAFLKNGITSVVGLLGADQLTRSLEGLIAKVRALRYEGVNAYCVTGAYQFPLPTFSGKPERDCYFLSEVIGIGEVALSDYRSSEPTTQELRRMLKDSLRALRSKGTKGFIIFHLGDEKSGLRPVIELLGDTDIDSKTIIATHINRNQQLMQEAHAVELQECWLDITAIYSKRTAESKGIFAEEAVIQLLEKTPALKERILVSSDGGTMVYPGIATHPGWLYRAFREIALRLGLPLAVKLFCENPARALGLEKKGHIKIGNDADLVILDKNLGIHTVVSQGRLLINAGVPVVHIDYYHEGYTYSIDRDIET
jgi:beta-aspartyl-dipeptidase (metallo-type)